MRFIDQLRKYRVALRSIAQRYTSLHRNAILRAGDVSEHSESHMEMYPVPYFLAENGTCVMSSDCVNAKCFEIDSAMPFILDGCFRQFDTQPAAVSLTTLD